MRITIKLGISIFLFAFIFYSCNKDENTDENQRPEIEVTSAEISANTHEIDPGATLQLSRTVLPVNATDKSLEWKSSDEAIATFKSIPELVGQNEIPKDEAIKIVLLYENK